MRVGGGGRRGHRSRQLAPSLVVSSGGEDTEDTFPPEPLSIKEEGTAIKECLLDIMHVSLKSMDLKTAVRLSPFAEGVSENDVIVGNFILRISGQEEATSLLKDKLELKLQIERNLDKAFNHRVPDLSIKGVLSLCHISMDVSQYQV